MGALMLSFTSKVGNLCHMANLHRRGRVEVVFQGICSSLSDFPKRAEYPCGDVFEYDAVHQ